MLHCRFNYYWSGVIMGNSESLIPSAVKLLRRRLDQSGVSAITVALFSSRESRLSHHREKENFTCLACEQHLPDALF